LPTSAPADPADPALPGADGPLHGVAPDLRWWPGVAALVLDLARDGAAGPAVRDLRAVVVIVPSPRHAPLLRAALYEALGRRAFVAPRIRTLEDWAGVDAADLPGRRADVFDALRGSAWVRERFGTQAGALWTLARDIALLSDELTLAACGAAEAFEGRWRAAVQRNFSQRAAAAGDPQVQLVLALWRASLARDGGAARLRERLQQRAQGAAAAGEAALVWLAPQGAAAWQLAYCRAYSAWNGLPARLVVPDLAAFARSQAWLAAAWPERFDPAPDVPVPAIAVRARALRTGAPPPVRILGCDTLEEEAQAAAQWTVDRVGGGAALVPGAAGVPVVPVVLVALDRLTARRVRALLERAGVLVADESGWKLSTTSAAAAVMRWVDLVISDFSARDLDDWLRSPFTLAAEPDKPAIAAAIDAALRRAGVLAGTAAVRRAIALHRAADARCAADAVRIIEQMAALAQRWQRPGPLGRFLGLLLATLEQLGMAAALADDPVGRRVLLAVQQLHDHLVGSSLVLDLAEFRALLAEHFEEMASGDDAIDSPVVMTTLAGTRQRRFGAALLIGADADHLPGGMPVGGLLAKAVRHELGLRTDAERQAEQTLDLAVLLACTPQVAATWRRRTGDEPRPLSPLLERLALLVELSGRPPLVSVPAAHAHAVPAQPALPRAPVAPGRLPARVSASAYQDLIDCPYRFFGLRVLGLREPLRLRPLPDKRDFGVLLHAALFAFHRQGDTDAEHAPGPALHALRAAVDAVFAPLLEQRPALLGYRQRLRALLPGYIDWLGRAQREGWRWHDGERALQRPLVPPQAAPSLFGRIDRIDVDAHGHQRILDYKSRDAAALRRGQREPGEEIQLLFYGLLLEPAPQAAAYLSLQRPPDPDQPLRDVVTLVAATQPLAPQLAALQQRLVHDLGRVGAGAPLPANGAEPVCRRCELRSLCRHGFTPAPVAAHRP